MKKTLLLKLLTLVFTLCSVLFIATGCNFECTEHKEKWIIDKKATCTSQGIMHAECELCGRYMGAEIIEQSEHNYVNHVCKDCGQSEGTEGLSYMKNADGTGYILTGIGMATESEIIVHSVYKDLPVVGIAKESFLDNDLITKITIPNSVTSIGEQAFSNCSSLTSIEIPNSVTSIAEWAFFCCSSLTSVTIGNGDIGSSAFGYCRSLTSVTIGNGDIGSSAFEDCSSLTSVTIDNGDIGSGAFYNCSSLTSVTIGNGVTSIGNFAFYNCSSLTKINYLGTIDEWVQISFSGSILPSSTAKLYINDELITNANITTATRISSYAFCNCDSLTSITIPNSVTSIGDYAFRNCSSLTSITIPNSVTSIGDYAFRNCSSLQYNIENNLKYLGNSVNPYLYLADTTSTSITTATINENCKFIGDSAFSDCSSLTSIKIPNSVTSIGEQAFEDCSSLTRVYYNGTAQEWNNISISGNNSHLKSATRYYYIENQEDLPNDGGNYWHYVDGVPTVWTKTEN